MDTKKTPIIITGMDRSGTSLVGSLVWRWGAYGGDEGLLSQGNRDNPAGFFENIPLQRTIGSILGNTPFWDPNIQEILQEKAASPENRQKIQDLIAQMTGQDRPWFWKEPLLAIALPLFKDFFDDMVFVIPVRNPYESAVSWQRFMVPPRLSQKIHMIPANLLRWQYIMREVLTRPSADSAKIFVSYENLLRDPEVQCGRLSQFLDEHYGTGELRQDRVAYMAEAINSDLWRNREPGTFDEVVEATPTQKRLYSFLREKLDDPDKPFDPDDYQMPHGWREQLYNVYHFILYYRHAGPVMESKTLAVYMGFLRILSGLITLPMRLLSLFRK